MAYKIKNKRLIGHSKDEDFYEDTKGETYSYKDKKMEKLKEKKADDTFYLQEHNFSWEKNTNGTMKVSLGNMTDAGWYWNGNEKDLNGFLFRLENSAVKDEFYKDVSEKKISFDSVKPYLEKSVKDNDGLYELSGDNKVWDFGEGQDEDFDSSYELEEEHFNEEQKNQFYSEWTSISYEDFEKKYGKAYQKEMKKAIEQSNSFEQFAEKQKEIAEQFKENRGEENRNRAYETINKIKKETK